MPNNHFLKVAWWNLEIFEEKHAAEQRSFNTWILVSTVSAFQREELNFIREVTIFWRQINALRSWEREQNRLQHFTWVESCVQFLRKSRFISKVHFVSVLDVVKTTICDRDDTAFQSPITTTHHKSHRCERKNRKSQRTFALQQCDICTLDNLTLQSGQESVKLTSFEELRTLFSYGTHQH